MKFNTDISSTQTFIGLVSPGRGLCQGTAFEGQHVCCRISHQVELLFKMTFHEHGSLQLQAAYVTISECRFAPFTDTRRRPLRAPNISEIP